MGLWWRLNRLRDTEQLEQCYQNRKRPATCKGWKESEENLRRLKKRQKRERICNLYKRQDFVREKRPEGSLCCQSTLRGTGASVSWAGVFKHAVVRKGKGGGKVIWAGQLCELFLSGSLTGGSWVWIVSVLLNIPALLYYYLVSDTRAIEASLGNVPVAQQ
jgi:hypothetical protein